MVVINEEYTERVYSGILGKIIGVYLGRPCEGWTYEEIIKEIGEINYYINEKFKLPLVLADDDICGTFTFLRAITEHNRSLEISSEQIGQTLLNYLIENRTIIWWGGLGNSAEHTAFLRLKNGIKAPLSGSIKLNGRIIAEQIGAQIFIDGWAFMAPGDPELASDLAKRAASVTHDGEAVYAAQVIASMESLAFIEPDIGKLLDTAISIIPRDSIVYKAISDIREWVDNHREWQETRRLIEENYGYDKFLGNCHIIPNHCLIIMSLLYGKGDFQQSLKIVNTSGWDTDCNSGNLGCLLGIRNGLKCFEGNPDWRGPVRDRLYLPTADGGRAITDAVIETYNIVDACCFLNGKEFLKPKQNARFNFELPGSVQGFYIKEDLRLKEKVEIINVKEHSRKGSHSLAINYSLNPSETIQVATPTFIPPKAIDIPGSYELMCSPTLYSGQTVRIGISAGSGNKYAISIQLFINSYNSSDNLMKIYGPEIELKPGVYREVSWKINEPNGFPIAEIGIEIKSSHKENGKIYLDYLTWDGSPDIVLENHGQKGNMWYRAWVNGVDDLILDKSSDYIRLVQNEGSGLYIYGSNDWKSYSISANLRSLMAKSFGICARVQGMNRYYALLLSNDDTISIVKVIGRKKEILFKRDYKFDIGKKYYYSLEVDNNMVAASMDNEEIIKIEDNNNPLLYGGIALICEEGCVDNDLVIVK